MYLKYGLLADAVVPGAMGKKNIIGTFSTIFSQQIPCLHPSLSLAIRIEGNVSEIGQHQIEVGFVDADYRAIRDPVNANFNLEKEKVPIEGIPAAVEATINIQNLQLPKIGSYEFTIKVDGRHLGSVPLYLVRASQSPPVA